MTTHTHEEVVRAARRLYDLFPSLRRDLLKVQNKRAMYAALRPLLGAGVEHTQDECVKRLTKDGLKVVRKTPSASRRRSGVRVPTQITAESQKGRLLAAYALVGSVGLTSQEASRVAMLPPQACYWARVSELTQEGLLEVRTDEDGKPVQRVTDNGTMRDVYVITDDGEVKHRVIFGRKDDE